MKRSIKFRGQREDTKEWVYGSLIEDKYIVDNVIDWSEDYFNTEYWWRVITETVGQFTGLYDGAKWEHLTFREKELFLSEGNEKSDWKGKEIYEGDIVLAKCSPSGKGKSSIKIHKCIFDWSNSFS